MHSVVMVRLESGPDFSIYSVGNRSVTSLKNESFCSREATKIAQDSC